MRYGEWERNQLKLVMPAKDESVDPPSLHQSSVCMCVCVCWGGGEGRESKMIYTPACNTISLMFCNYFISFYMLFYYNI